MIYPDLVYKIRGVAFDIFNKVTGNWNEAIYEDIMFDTLIKQGIEVKKQEEFIVFYQSERVGQYFTDLLVENKVILELKVVDNILPLHQAQLISYLKVTGLKLGLLINFGSSPFYIKSFPNKMEEAGVLRTNFDIGKVNLPIAIKQKIEPYLKITKQILEYLGPGYFPQVYRRSFWYELRCNHIEFILIKKFGLMYNDKIYGTSEVRFFKIDDLLISIVTVHQIDELSVKKFFKFIKHYNCRDGLIINFNNTIVDFKYINSQFK